MCVHIRFWVFVCSLTLPPQMGPADGVPTLIVHGKADVTLPQSHAEAAHAAMPWSELYLVEEASNMLWIGQEGESVSRRVIAFLMGLMERGKVDELHHFQPSNALKNDNKQGLRSNQSSKHKQG